MKTYKFHVLGMHCASCKVLTENELSGVAGVTKVKASLKDNSVEVVGDFADLSPEKIAENLTKFLQPHGYSLSIEKQNKKIKWLDFKIAVPAALGFIAIFIILQKLGLVNLIGGSKVTYGTAFTIGIVASLSSCMAVVGGLVLSMSANFAKEGDKIRPQILFHLGRLGSFFVLGGVIGAVGSVFTLGGTGTFILSLIVGIILLILGINLLDIFPWMKKLQPSLPSFLGKHVQGLKNLNHTLTPLVIGIATFFLPCGFTQSMQLYTLSTGNFWTGAMTMFVFALGTLPVLAALSFSSFAIVNKSWSGAFFKTAGIIVIFFGLFNVLNSLVAVGFIPPLFNL